ncbi:MAG TPA: NUDIX hydrolase [Ilumatobacteraceae bacterium]|nr:NUDIX hydrolase [Ilumatobacteraceae bacterium]
MSSPPAFRHLGDRLVHQGYIWNVVVATFEAPEGELFERDVIRSPGAVGVVPLLFEDGVPTVVFVRQYRGPLDQYVLEIPAGMRDVPDEPLELTAERELIEEAGFSAGRMEYLTNFFSSAGMTDSVLHIYLATDLSPVAREMHGPEETHMEVLRLPLAEAVEMVARGEINDAKTVIGLLLVDRRLHEGNLAPPS